MLNLYLCLVLASLTHVKAFLLDDSCQRRCGAGFDKAFSCQCNTQCLKYNDCCTEYTAICTSAAPSTCGEFAELTQQLWDNDVDRLASADVTINQQAQVGYTDFSDKAPQRLFTYVDETKLTSRVYSTYLALLDNYDPDKYDPEVVTASERAEEDAFLDAILSTATMKRLFDYLNCEGKVQSMSDMRSMLRRLWFELYRRSPSSASLDTSGFEHVMAGEYKSSTVVNGLHYWLAFYQGEKGGEINYYGHSCATRFNSICAAYEWNGRRKQNSSFFLRSSPAFDMAVYTLCFTVYPSQVCPVVIDGRTVNIKTYITQGHVSTAFIAS